MRVLVFVAFCVGLFSFTEACTKDELVLLQVISNRGSAAPDQLYATDPNPPFLWREGLGELTMLGKFQPFALGSFLRVRYSGFITSDPMEVEVRSASSRSCVMSATSEVTALYAPILKHEVVLYLPWQPIMVNYQSTNDDKIFSTSPCPTADQEYQQILNSPETQQFFLQNQDLLEFWSLNSGWNIKDWDSVRGLNSILETELSQNLTVPPWAMKYRKKMQFISEQSYRWNSKTKVLKRLRGGPLLKLVMEKMLQKTIGSTSPKKVFLYVTNEDNMVSFLNTMNLFNGRTPPPCATIVVELYKHLDRHYVRMFYLNSTTPEFEPQFLRLMNIEGCPEFCPLENIVRNTRDVIPENWDEECQLK